MLPRFILSLALIALSPCAARADALDARERIAQSRREQAEAQKEADEMASSDRKLLNTERVLINHLYAFAKKHRGITAESSCEGRRNRDDQDFSTVGFSEALSMHYLTNCKVFFADGWACHAYFVSIMNPYGDSPFAAGCYDPQANEITLY